MFYIAKMADGRIVIFNIMNGIVVFIGNEKELRELYESLLKQMDSKDVPEEVPLLVQFIKEEFGW